VRLGAGQQRGGDLAAGLRPLRRCPLAFEQLRIVDGDPGRERQCASGNLVGFGEHARGVVVGQINVAEHRPTDGDRHRKKGPHERVVLGKSHGGRVRGQIVHPQSRRVEERQAQQPLANR